MKIKIFEHEFPQSIQIMVEEFLPEVSEVISMSTMQINRHGFSHMILTLIYK